MVHKLKAKIRKPSSLALLVITLLIIFVSLNVFILAAAPTEILQDKLMAASISRGDSYVGTLRLWKLYVLHGDWATANKIATKLDPADTLFFRQLYSPDLLRSQINSLQFQTDKTPDEWIKLAQLYYRLGYKKLTREALLSAQKLDPVRDDINSLLSSLN